MESALGSDKKSIDRLMINFKTNPETGFAERRSNTRYIDDNIYAMSQFYKISEYYGPIRAIVGGRKNR